MYKYPFCVNNSPTVKFLIAHLKLAHSASSSTFVCKQQNCTRSFTNIYSFKRHLIQKHNQNNNFSVAPGSYLSHDNILCHDIKSNDNKSDQFETYINFEEFLTTETCEQLINDPLITLKQFDDIVTKRAALFVAKLYSNVVLSRSLAHEIIQHVDDLYKLTVEIIKYQYECQENKRNVP